MYSSGEIVLINFPFTNLIDSKIRPALVISEKKEDVIVIGIFSKVPDVIFTLVKEKIRMTLNI
jgi:mRNA interferase MazF